MRVPASKQVHQVSTDQLDRCPTPAVSLDCLLLTSRTGVVPATCSSDQWKLLLLPLAMVKDLPVLNTHQLDPGWGTCWVLYLSYWILHLVPTVNTCEWHADPDWTGSGECWGRKVGVPGGASTLYTVPHPQGWQSHPTPCDKSPLGCL